MFLAPGASLVVVFIIFCFLLFFLLFLFSDSFENHDTQRNNRSTNQGSFQCFSTAFAGIFIVSPVVVKVVKFLADGGGFSGSEVGILLTGCAVAFAVSMLCIRFLMNYVKKHDFKVFGWYRIGLGALVLAYFYLLKPAL